MSRSPAAKHSANVANYYNWRQGACLECEDMQVYPRPMSVVVVALSTMVGYHPWKLAALAASWVRQGTKRRLNG
jgi:hypothetical protein